VSYAYAEPPNPGVEFYGWVVHQGRYAPTGTLVTAHFRDGAICGESVVEAVGQYTRLSCSGNSSRTGEQIVFRINYDKAATDNNQSFVPGEIRQVDLYTGGIEEVKSVLREIPALTLCKNCLLRVVFAGGVAILLLTLAFGLGRWTKRKL
jgi:hypothetical protein